MEITYKFESPIFTKKSVNDEEYTTLYFKGYSHLKEVGKPALPSHNDLVAVPLNAKYSIEIVSANYTTVKDYLIFPALQPAVDTYGADEHNSRLIKNFIKKI